MAADAGGNVALGQPAPTLTAQVQASISREAREAAQQYKVVFILK